MTATIILYHNPTAITPKGLIKPLHTVKHIVFLRRLMEQIDEHLLLLNLLTQYFVSFIVLSC